MELKFLANYYLKEKKIMSFKYNKIMASLALILLFASVAICESKNESGGKNPMDGMDPAQMERMQKAASPSEHHKILSGLVGEWTHVVKWRMDPAGKFEESTGKSSNRMIMDGRFLEQTATGESMGQPFKGLGLTGFDNIKGEYSSIWIDNMSTGMMVAAGKLDPKSNTIKESGTLSCPMTGERNVKFRSDWHVISKDSYSYEMFTRAPDGTEFKSMEISYKRVGQA